MIKSIRYKNLIGITFHNLTPIRYLGVIQKGNTVHPVSYWECRCICGNLVEVNQGKLSHKNHGLKSCGCLTGKLQTGAKPTHGLTNTSEYGVWVNMRSRCSNSNTEGYRNYGRRGITVSPEWVDSFERFILDMGRKPSPKHSIERIDNAKGYSADNCKWAINKEQQNNKRTNKILTYQGVSLTHAQWQDKLGFNRGTIYNRIKAGWDTERILTTPVR